MQKYMNILWMSVCLHVYDKRCFYSVPLVKCLGSDSFGFYKITRSFHKHYYPPRPSHVAFVRVEGKNLIRQTHTYIITAMLR